MDCTYVNAGGKYRNEQANFYRLRFDIRQLHLDYFVAVVRGLLTCLLEKFSFLQWNTLLIVHNLIQFRSLLKKRVNEYNKRVVPLITTVVRF